MRRMHQELHGIRVPLRWNTGSNPASGNVSANLSSHLIIDSANAVGSTCNLEVSGSSPDNSDLIRVVAQWIERKKFFRQTLSR